MANPDTVPEVSWGLRYPPREAWCPCARWGKRETPFERGTGRILQLLREWIRCATSARVMRAVGEQAPVPSPGRTLKLAMPLVLSNFSVAFMQFTDTLFVSRLGGLYQGAILTPTMLIAVITAFAVSYFSSVTTFVSQYQGAGDEDRVGAFAWNGLFLALYLGAGSLFLYPLASQVVDWFGHEPEVRELEASYLRVSLLGMPAAMGSMALSAYFYGLQRTGVATVATVTGILANIVVTYGLVFGKLGFPEMGFDGAAWGTFWAGLLEFGLLAALFLFGRHSRRFAAKGASFSPEKQAALNRLALPAGIQAAVDLLSWGVAVVWMIGQFGTVHLAAASVLIRCMYLTFLPADGVALALVTLVGNAIGANRLELARAEVRTAFTLIATYMLSVGILYYLFRSPIMQAFTDDPEIIRIGVQAMVWVSLFQFFDALNVTYLNALLGAGDNLWPSVANVLFTVVILIGGGLCVVRYFPQLQSFGIWMVVAIYVLAQGLTFWARWRAGKWRFMRVVGTHE